MPDSIWPRVLPSGVYRGFRVFGRGGQGYRIRSEDDAGLSEREARAIISISTHTPLAALPDIGDFSGENPYVHPTFTLTTVDPRERFSNDKLHRIHEDPEFGDFIVLLPGLFQLRHAGQTKSLNFAHQSRLSTSSRPSTPTQADEDSGWDSCELELSGIDEDEFVDDDNEREELEIRFISLT
ncbi:hypothetical protein GGX14DRAFT_385549 [Mycena pura]|uniref:Uncharacterized protein n=1 Tax=Mycena pura TaxID=153505 RepID=A0AAD6YQU5_9AGAR|nr:hypothetical protein GGX14DRAFT_385549 [Mycena pura]